MTEGRGRTSVATIRRRVVARTTLLVALLAAALVPSPVAAVEAPERRAARSYIVTLDVADAGRSIDPAARTGRQRVRLRAQRTRAATVRLERAHGIRATHRFTHAIPGFAARLTPREVAELRRDDSVASIVVARPLRLASQTTPPGILRVKAQPGGTGPVDADIAIIDTGIGPVGGGELNVHGGINCSDDGRGPDVWQDLTRSHHGTHVAGIAAARDNGIGVVGVAPGARLWAVRVFDRSGFGTDATLICGLDWVASTRGPLPPPGSQPIDVANMSIQIDPRRAGDVETCTGRPVPDPDPLHLAVCSVEAAGITMVVAAGNGRTDARHVSPAAYDQVVTVAAMNDFDGKRGGRGESVCGVDDRFAVYSNWGADVDIVAPGTCVRSTSPSFDGAATDVLSGTSMAAPHVTGAVARHLAAHPETTPRRMRTLVRAAGRLDWELRSDPSWDGPVTGAAPLRLLDVSALFGPPGLRAWLMPQALVADADTSERRARVDLQRLGGFDEDVELDLDGLPGRVGSASISPSTLEHDDLGGRLTIDLEPDAADGRHVLRVDAAGGPQVRGKGLRLRVDRSGPIVDRMRAAFRGGRDGLPTARSASVRVSWSVEDALGDVGRTALQQRVGGSSWRDVASGRGLTAATTTVRAGTRTALRVTSHDDLGNVSRSSAHQVRLAIRDSSSAKWSRPAAGWQGSASGSAIGRSLLTTRSRTSSLSTEVEGDALALVAPIGPGLGSFRVRVDGRPWQRVDLRASRSRARRVVFTAALGNGTHALEIRAISGQVAIDALLILR